MQMQDHGVKVNQEGDNNGSNSVCEMSLDGKLGFLSHIASCVFGRRCNKRLRPTKLPAN